jgi:hypothetical protein
MPSRPWRCHTCGALLGLLHGGELHLKYCNVEHWITGRCRHVCRRCRATNTVDVSGAAELGGR